MDDRQEPRALNVSIRYNSNYKQMQDWLVGLNGTILCPRYKWSWELRAVRVIKSSDNSQIKFNSRDIQFRVQKCNLYRNESKRIDNSRLFKTRSLSAWLVYPGNVHWLCEVDFSVTHWFILELSLKAKNSSLYSPSWYWRWALIC